MTRKKIPREEAAEYAKRAKEYHDYQIHRHQGYLDETKDAIVKALEAQYIAAQVIPTELYREMYESPIGEPMGGDLATSQPWFICAEQTFRLFPKEMYMRTFYSLNIAKHMIKHSKDDERRDWLPDEDSTDDFDEEEEGLTAEIDYDALRRYREDLLTAGFRDLELKPLKPLGIKPSGSGEEDMTTEEETASSSATTTAATKPVVPKIELPLSSKI